MMKKPRVTGRPVLEDLGGREPMRSIRAFKADREKSSWPERLCRNKMSREQLIEFYRLMYLSRRTDDREIQLKKQQKIFFQISCAGMRRCWWLPGWRCGRDMTGFSRTIAIGRSA
jgi:hypothetical protein